jgi:RNA polymerase sigma-70 factor, ECF subfamily
MFSRDPLAQPEPLIRRVYAYVAYRIGDGPDAEDVTSEVFERAVRYRSSFDPERGDAAGWLIGIARRCVEQRGNPRTQGSAETEETVSPEDLEDQAVRRVHVRSTVASLPTHERELIALRYGADLTARQIGELLEMSTNAVEVALHRALRRLRGLLGEEEPDEAL